MCTACRVSVMVRTMQRRLMPLFLSVSLVWGRARLAGAAMGLVTVALLAGCASSPSPVGSRGPAAAVRPVDAGVRQPDRDGAPSDAPPNLAALPDPVPQIEPIKASGPNKPYVVLGQAYEPVAADVSWNERGVASWYGTKFHGRRTASGEMFSMYGLTAAHRTLPIPSYARVRNVRNGKETIVRVNDRGPFHSSRVIDLSYAAAVKLGIVSLGSAEVEIERLTFDQIRTGAWRRDQVDTASSTQLAAAPSITQASASPDGAEDPIMSVAGKAGLSVAPSSEAAAPLAQPVSTAVPAAVKEAQARAYTPDAKGFWVQLAALGKRDGVDRLQQKVASELTSLLPLLAVFHEAPYFKLQVGPYGSRGEALAAAQQARDALQLTPLVVERR